MKRFTEEEKLLARLAVGFHSQLRYYRTLESIGMTWATSVREAIQVLHDKNMTEINAFITERETA